MALMSESFVIDEAMDRELSVDLMWHVKPTRSCADEFVALAHFCACRVALAPREKTVPLLGVRENYVTPRTNASGDVRSVSWGYCSTNSLGLVQLEATLHSARAG